MTNIQTNPSAGTRFLQRGTHLLVFCLILISVQFLSACSRNASGTGKDADSRKKMVVPVTVSTAVQKAVPLEIVAIGNVQPYARVAMKAQIAGELVKVHFSEGQEVNQEDLLFTIDPQPFEAKLKQAEANLAKDRAQLENARKQAERYASVVKRGLVSAEQYDQVMANVATLEASVKADQAAVENARIELQYCFIRSPISGVAGALKVDRGNIVKANDNDNPLVTINQIQPIYVSFSVPEFHLPDIKKYMASKELEVTVRIPGSEDLRATGKMTFLDNAVDASTGTIQLKATLPNQDRMLWPGQFVNVALVLTTQPDAVVLPSQTVQTGQQGPYVFVVNSEFKVDYRPVVVGRVTGNEIVIDQGVSPGEKIVTDGQLRLAPGIQVKIVDDNQKGGEENQQ